MSRLVAFDAKEFNRLKYKKIQDPANPDKMIEKLSGFYSPLGCGIVTEHPDILDSVLSDSFMELERSFGVKFDIPFLGSHEIKAYLGNNMVKAIAFADQLIQKVQDYIDFAFFSYIVLPPSENPTVRIGGVKSPTKEIDTYNFLRESAPAFSALTAWAFSSKRNLSDTRVLIDSFRYKKMRAWELLLDKIKPNLPEIYPHGDECNPYIALADILAFLTDVKLYKLGKNDVKYRRLTPDGIKEAWKDYTFEKDVWFLDNKSISFFAWYNNELIDLQPFVKRPIVFFIADKIEDYDVERSPDAPPIEEIPRERRFNKQLRTFPAFRAATKYAYLKGGSIQFYDRYQDAGLVRDGDVIVYMGENSRKIAQTFRDSYDIEIYTAKEIKEKMFG